jgi:hypothetical protein
MEKLQYNKLNLGDIGGIPRVLDAGQCNDSYSLALIALKHAFLTTFNMRRILSCSLTIISMLFIAVSTPFI